MNTVSLNLKVGIAVRALRNSRHLTQDQLAKKAEVPRSTIGNIEAGRRFNNIVSLEKIVSACGYKLSDLFRVVEDPLDIMKLKAQEQLRDRGSL